MAKKTRLDKFLCDSLNITRKEAKEVIKKGKVTINGEIVKKPESKLDAEDDQVELEHQPVIFEQFHYLMLHKPQGVVSATKDDHDKTVLDLIHENFKDKLFPVGRLDKDTEGLLILTDDGMLAHELLSPKKHVDKVYFAKVSGSFTDEEVKKFQEGLDIGNGERSKEADLEILTVGEDQSEVLITITEGKFHQVEELKNKLRGYDYIGVGRDDGMKRGEFTAIYYKTDRFELLDEGNFWLSSTPDYPSLGWDADQVRLCTWGKFKDKQTGFVFMFFNYAFL